MNSTNRSAELRDGTHAGGLILAFESFVSAGVEEIGARRQQALLIGALTIAGFVAAALASVAVFVGLPIGYSFLPLLAGAALLGSAGATAASGRPGLVLLFLSLAMAAIVALLAPIIGGAIAVATVVAGPGAMYLRRAPRQDATRNVPETAAPTHMLLLDAGGRIVSAGPAVADLAFRPGTPLVDRLPVQDRLAFLTAVDAVRAGAAQATCSVRLAAVDDQGLLAVALTIVGSAGGGLGVDFVAENGNTRGSDPALADALAAAQAASEAKSRLLAAVSHELRTPLNAIIGFTDILDQEIFGSFANDRQREYVRLIQSSGAHLLHVVNGLLDIAKIEAGRYEITPEPFNVEAEIRAAADMVSCEADRKGLRIDVRRVPREAAIFTADRRAFQQMLLNLLSNAVKFTAAGTVTVMARIEGGQQILTIADTGVGIADADLGRLAQPFVQLSASGSADERGTGLGLSLVKGLCELHGGAMDIASRRGQGTTVTLRLPSEMPEKRAGADNPNEKIVALNDARRKNVPSPQSSPKRRSA